MGNSNSIKKLIKEAKDILKKEIKYGNDNKISEIVNCKTNNAECSIVIIKLNDIINKINKIQSLPLYEEYTQKYNNYAHPETKYFNIKLNPRIENETEEQKKQREKENDNIRNEYIEKILNDTGIEDMYKETGILLEYQIKYIEELEQSINKRNNFGSKRKSKKSKKSRKVPKNSRKLSRKVSRKSRKSLRKRRSRV